MGEVMTFVQDGDAAFRLYLHDDAEPPTRLGHALIRLLDAEVWELADIAVTHDQQRKGYGRRLIAEIRELAADGDQATVYTYGADPSADGFYVRTGCLWDAGRLQFKIAPVSGEPVPDQDIRRPGLDYIVDDD